MNLLNEIKQGGISTSQYIVLLRRGIARHAYGTDGQRVYVSRPAIVADAANFAQLVHAGRRSGGLKADEYGEYVELPRTIDAHVRGGVQALERPDYYERVYLARLEELA